jgi:hypothetical protein
VRRHDWFHVHVSGFACVYLSTRWVSFRVNLSHCHVLCARLRGSCSEGWEEGGGGEKSG